MGRLNLVADKMRFAAAVGGVAFVVALILMIQALYAGYRESVKSFVENVPADLWVGQAGAFDLFRSTSLISEPVVARLATTPGVQSIGEIRGRQARLTAGDVAMPTLFLSFSPNSEAGIMPALGLDRMPGQGEIAISDYVHKKSGISAGDLIMIGGHELLVVDELALESPPFGSFSVINFEDANEIFDMGGSASFLLVSGAYPAAAGALASTMRTNVPEVSVFEKTEFARSNSRTVTEFLPVIGVLLVVSYLVGTVITGLTIYTATVEKTRDYGILKAIGARNSYVYGIVIYQSLAVSVLGFAIGAPLALAASLLAEDRVPEFITQYELTSGILTFCAVLGMGLLASVLPVRRITAIDPAVVFRA